MMKDFQVEKQKHYRILSQYRFVPHFERETSVSSTDSGVSISLPQTSMPSTQESSSTTDLQSKQSMIR